MLKKKDKAYRMISLWCMKNEDLKEFAKFVAETGFAGYQELLVDSYAENMQSLVQS